MENNNTLKNGGLERESNQKKGQSSLAILMVDDEPLICGLCAEVLMRAGYEVDTAQDGISAWKTLQSKKYDLLITDHNMAPLTGLELIKKLHAARMELPVIMASGTIPAEELNRHPWLKIKGVLLKPYSVDALLEEVKKILHLKNEDGKSSESRFDENPSQG